MTKTRYTFILILGLLMFAASSVAAQAPAVVNDTYSVNVNGTLTTDAATGVLANDTFNATTHRLESYDTRSQFGAPVTVNADGSFTYDPLPGFKGVDTFAYTVRNDQGASTGIVTIDVSGATVWFVHSAAAAGGDGSWSAPFQDFTQLNNAASDVDAAGETIFVYSGNYNVALTLEANQTLIGQGDALDLVGSANDVAADAYPEFTNSGVILTVSSGNTISGLNLNATAEYAVSGNGITNLTLARVSIVSNTAGGAINLNNASGTVSLTNVPIFGGLDSTRSAFRLTNSSANVTFTDSAMFSLSTGYAIYMSGNSGTVSFNANSDIAATSGKGIFIQNLTGTAVVTFAGINLTANAANTVEITGLGANATINFEEGVTLTNNFTNGTAFKMDAGKLKIGGTGSTLSAVDGPALVLSAVELTQNATFASISSNSSNAQGISITNPVGSNDIAVTGTTTVTNATNDAISVTHTAASGFTLTMSTLNGTTAADGIAVNNAGVAVTNAASTLTTTAGAAIDCSNGTTNLQFATLTASGGTNGLKFSSCSGTINATGGTLTSTAGAANHVIDIATSSVNLTYAGTITKNNQGAAVKVDGLTNPGAVNISGTINANTPTLTTSVKIDIANSTRTVTFSTLNLGGTSGGVGTRYDVTPIALSGNTGAVNLGAAYIYTSAATALNVSYANASPGQVSTSAGSVLNVTGNATALIVDHATQQSLSLQFASITNSGGGTHGIDINRGNGALVVTGTATFGAKTTAGIEITNSNNLVTSIKEVDITGAADGVRLLTNTGGSFTILGDGNFVNSHTNGAGGTFTNLTDNAFELSGISDFRVTDLTITGTGSHAVTGTGVNNAVFSNVDMTNIGNANGENVFNFQEGAVSGAQLSGIVDINNSVIENFTDNGMYLENFSGALSLSITNNTFRNNITTTACGGDNCDGNGLLIRADGTSSMVIFTLNNAFEQIDGVGITANPEGNAGATMDITIAQSAFTANAFAGAGNTNNGEVGISLRNAQGNSTMRARLFSNDLRNYTSELALGVIEIEGGDFTTTDAILDTNYIYHAHLGNAIGLFNDGANTAGSGTTNVTMRVSLIGNNVPAATPLFGTALIFNNNGAISGSTANTHLTVTNNNFLAVATGAARRTMTFNVRDFNNACFNITGNTVAAGTGGTQSSLNLSYNGSGTVRLQGMAGTGDANATAYLNSNNTLSVAAISGPNNNVSSATCQTPTPPTEP